MEILNNTIVTVEAKVNTPIDKVWILWTSPEHICQWNNASIDWHTTRAENNLMKGGHFNFRMEAKDGSIGFDFEGVYDNVEPYRFIEYTISGGRKVKVSFTQIQDGVHVIESFEAETENPVELQKSGWQAILDNFKKYAETTL